MADDPPRKSSPKKPRTGLQPKARMRGVPADAYWSFIMDNLAIVTLPLLEELRGVGGTDQIYDIIIDVSQDYPGGGKRAQAQIRKLIAGLVKAHGARGQGMHGRKTDLTRQYAFVRLRGDLILELVRKDLELAREEARPPALHRIWPDFEVQALTDRTIATVKADAARNAFGALGRDILWAVVDSGIDAGHPHFQKHGNLKLEPPLRHCDFTTFGEFDEDESERAALTDEKGHGTHVAGIIAGALEAGPGATITAIIERKDEQGKVSEEERSIEAISGMAPACKLISFKVLDKNGKGPVSNLIAVCDHIQEINGNGRYIRIHGVNMSVGYDFEPSWFVNGQSPLCTQIDRLVRTGVLVVAPAGNTGYGWSQSAFRGAVPAGMNLTINDPGNAELAITVGSTHRENPLAHGISYFSSKGPTGDGRLKPDLVAPGENIVSCWSGAGVGRYREDSGTSMAAAHVSGAIAAFLSVCREFLGRPEEVKEIFMSTATDLKQDPSFQGHGLIDLLRAVSTVRTVSKKTAQTGDTARIRRAVSAARAVVEKTMFAGDAAPLRVFISYSHKDEKLCSRLSKHLGILRRNGVINAWHDRLIDAGQEWAGAIDEHLNSAAIIVLLVSADFLDSDYCYDKEMSRALARHDAGEAVVIPVILRHVEWKNAPFARLQALPKDGRPVTSWPSQDQAFADIARGIQKVAEKLRSVQSHARR